MRSSILVKMLLGLLLVVVLSAVNCFSANSSGDSFGFSSEDWGSGSYLGVDTRDITPDRLSALHLKEEKGVEVTMVDQDAPAGKAGLKEQDVILTLNGAEVESVEQLRRMIRETPPGRVIALGVSRNGQPMTFKVQLADRKNSFAYTPQSKEFHFQMPNMSLLPDTDLPASVVVVHSSMRSGLSVENLSPQLGEFFGAKNGQGVLVRSVDKGSLADKAGFRAGDVIVKVNDEPIHDAGDFTHALRSRKNNTVNVGVLRDKKEQTITLTLPERKQSDLHESWEMPGAFDENCQEMSQWQSDMANLKPELDKAISRALADAKRQMEQATRETHIHRDEIQKQMRDLQHQLRDRQREIEKEFKKDGQDHSSDI